MTAADEADRLTSEVESTNIVGQEAISKYVVSKGLSPARIIQFYSRLQENNPKKYRPMVADWIKKNIYSLIEIRPTNMIALLESLGVEDTIWLRNILLDLPEAEIVCMQRLYNLIEGSPNKNLKIASGILLGSIGIKNQKIFNEIMSLPLAYDDDDKKISFLVALRNCSNKLKNPNFILEPNAAEFILQCSKSSNDRLVSEATSTCIVLFEQCPTKFKEVIFEYFQQSPEHRIFVYNHLDQNDLSDTDFELSLLGQAVNSIDSELEWAQWVLASKIFRSQGPLNKFLNKRTLQSFALDFFGKILRQRNINNPKFDESLMEYVGEIDIHFASDYLLKLISNEDIDENKQISIYPELISGIFTKHENDHIQFLKKLSTREKFSSMVYADIKLTIEEIHSRINLRFDTFNKTIVQDLNQHLEAVNVKNEFNQLPTTKLDEFITQMDIAIGKIDEFQPLARTNDGKLSFTHKKTELKNDIEYVRRKIEFIHKALDLLIEHTQKRKLDHKRLTANFRSIKIGDLIMQCEILTYELLKPQIQTVDCMGIVPKLDAFPLIKKYFGHEWVEKECQRGYPYHQVVTWLSKLVDEKEIKEAISDWKVEDNQYLKESKLRHILHLMWPYTWLNHVNHCLEYFSSNEHGKSIIISGLKGGSFFQFLSQLDFAIRLKEKNYSVELEVLIEANKRIDIVAKKEGVQLVFESVTLSEYSWLKYAGFVSNVPDRPYSYLIEKIRKQISFYAKFYKNPIILLLNLTDAYDADMHGITHALQGSDVGHVVFDKNFETHKTFTTFERNKEFLEWEEGKKLSAVINSAFQYDNMKIKLVGGIIPNETAEFWLGKGILNEMKDILAGN